MKTRIAVIMLTMLALMVGGFFDGHRAEAKPDRTPPTQPTGLHADDVTQSSVTISWNASTDNVGVVGYYKVRDGFEVGDTDNQLSYTFAPAIWADQCGTTHSLSVRAYDAAGNQSTPASLQVQLDPCADTQPPSTPTNLVEVDDSPFTATAGWNASTDNVGVAGYKVNGVDAGNVLLWQFSGLTCGQSVSVSVVAYDAAGNESSPATGTVDAEPCNTPPTAPLNLVKTGSSSNSIDIAWDPASDDHGVAGYYKERDGVRVSDSDADLSFTFAPAIWGCGESHVLKVIAYDAEGLEGPAATLTATTAACPVASSVYWGARITASFYANNYGGTGNDAPLTGSTDPTGAWTLFEQHAGKEVSFVHWGGAGNAWPPSTFNATAAQRAWDNGAFSMYGLSLPQTGLDALLANNADAEAKIGALADQMKAWGKPILFRPLWEMNGAWFAWGRQNYTPEEYKTIWHNLWTIFQNHGATNVSFAWVPNVCTGSTGVCLASDAVPDPSPWRPLLGEFDWAGFEGYVKTGYMTPEARFGPTYDVMQQIAPGKPLVIGEWGIRAGLSAPGKAQFFTDMLNTWLPSHPQVKAMSYFNDDGDTPDVQIEEGDSIGELNSEALTAWQNGIADSYYESNAAATFPTTGKVPEP